MPGKRIRELREECGLRPTDVERLSRRLAEDIQNGDYFIPHGTLNGIENGSIPTIYKLASLAQILQVSIAYLLEIYGIRYGQLSHPALTDSAHSDDQQHTVPQVLANFRQTQLLHEGGPLWEFLPVGVLRSLGNSHRFSYAVIGLEDDTLGDVLPGGSFVEIDREQKTITRSGWPTIRERPIYCLWHDEGHLCCWCDQTVNVITVVPHPLSRRQTKQLRLRDVTVLGRVTNAWSLLRNSALLQ